MSVSYRIVWVSPDSPDIVEDVYGDGFDISEAQRELDFANKISPDDGLNWIARIQKVTKEFV